MTYLIEVLTDKHSLCFLLIVLAAMSLLSALEECQSTTNSFVGLPTHSTVWTSLSPRPWFVRLEFLGHWLDGARFFLLSFHWVSNSISRLLTWFCISTKFLYRLFDTTSLISVLRILKYWNILTCYDEAYSGQNKALLVNILVIMITDSVVYLSDK